MAGFDLICCVVNMGDASKTLKSARKHGAKGGTIYLGKGTVANRFLDMFGLSEMRKEILHVIVEEEMASSVLAGISKDMGFHKPNSGIAFSHSLSGFFGRVGTSANDESISEVSSSMYKIIHVVVDKGKGGDVIEAANKAGARGGTILNARGAGINEAQKLFSIEIEPEKESVFIITKSEMKDSIIESVRTSMEIDKPGKGIIYVLDIKEVYGLHQE